MFRPAAYAVDLHIIDNLLDAPPTRDRTTIAELEEELRVMQLSAPVSLLSKAVEERMAAAEAAQAAKAAEEAEAKAAAEAAEAARRAAAAGAAWRVRTPAEDAAVDVVRPRPGPALWCSRGARMCAWAWSRGGFCCWLDCCCNPARKLSLCLLVGAHA